MAKSKHYYIRKIHRWLGVILGIQFLLWTIGGLYFSWSNMDEVHGDFQKKNATLLSSDISLVSPTVVLDTIKPLTNVQRINPTERCGISNLESTLPIRENNNPSVPINTDGPITIQIGPRKVFLYLMIKLNKARYINCPHLMLITIT